jgi:hypothetical protein
VGEQIKYLALAQGRPLACVGFTSAPRHLGPRDRFVSFRQACMNAKRRPGSLGAPRTGCMGAQRRPPPGGQPGRAGSV